MLRSDLCDYSHVDIVVERTIDLLAAATPENLKAQKSVAFKNNASVSSYKSKISNTLIDYAGGLNIVMPMYDLLEYSEKIQ